MQAVISFIVFMITIMVIGYIIGIFALGAFNIAQLGQTLLTLNSVAQQTTIGQIETYFFHVSGVIIILLQLARVFMSYLRTQEIGILRVVELGIIAGLFEVLFDAKDYPIETQYLLTALILVLSAFYLYIRFVRGVNDLTTVVVMPAESEIALTEPRPTVREAVSVMPKRTPVRRAAISKKTTRTVRTKKATATK